MLCCGLLAHCSAPKANVDSGIDVGCSMERRAETEGGERRTHGQREREREGCKLAVSRMLMRSASACPLDPSLPAGDDVSPSRRVVPIQPRLVSLEGLAAAMISISRPTAQKHTRSHVRVIPEGSVTRKEGMGIKSEGAGNDLSNLIRQLNLGFLIHINVYVRPLNLPFRKFIVCQ